MGETHSVLINNRAVSIFELNLLIFHSFHIGAQNQNRSREASFDAFFQKHAGPDVKSSSSSRSAPQSKKAKKSVAEYVISDDDFQRIQAEMQARRSGNK